MLIAAVMDDVSFPIYIFPFSLSEVTGFFISLITLEFSGTEGAV
jgi:hypothetical protein